MSGAPRVALQVGVCLASLLFAVNTGAQSFGRNIVEYENFKFKVLETEHFSVYYYSSEEEAARRAARLARARDHQLVSRQPLSLYGSRPEFSQTNVVGGLLSNGIGGVTESVRRRIVMPLAPTLAETDHVLGHEIANAFHFDITTRDP